MRSVLTKSKSFSDCLVIPSKARSTPLGAPVKAWAAGNAPADRPGTSACTGSSARCPCGVLGFDEESPGEGDVRLPGGLEGGSATRAVIAFILGPIVCSARVSGADR